MSTIVQMPVRVKPPPADTGEIISPGCASFGNHDARKRRADGEIIQVLLRQRDAALGYRDVAAPGIQARRERSDLGICCVQLGLGAQLLLAQRADRA